MRTRHRRPARTRYLVLATCALGAMGAGVAGIASAQTTGHRPHATAHAAPLLAPATNAAASNRPRHTRRPRPSASATTGPTPSGTPATDAPTTAPAPTTVAPTSDAPSSPPPATAPTTAPTTQPATDAVIASALTHINAARTAAGLTPYVLSPDLSKASAAHNALMVAGCGLLHQCPGEAGLGDRFTAAGVAWTSAGENIGQGNAADNPDAIAAAANGLTDLMLAEVAPDDGHRRNLLNPGFRTIGLAVTRGSDGRVWMTQDFVN